MKKLLLLLTIFALPSPQAHAATTPKSTLEKFYKGYFKKIKKPQLPFSKSFQTLIEKNAQICKEKAGADICGFGANGDIYLDAQEVDPILNYKNSGIEFTEVAPGKINVKLNVYPSIKNPNGPYLRNILFSMVKEKGKWVADDIYHRGKSSRAEIQKEIESFTDK